MSQDTNASASGELNCTCPSGDGSLRWPCPKHPPESVCASAPVAAAPAAQAATGATVRDILDKMAHDQRWCLAAHALDAAFSSLQAELRCAALQQRPAPALLCKDCEHGEAVHGALCALCHWKTPAQQAEAAPAPTAEPTDEQIIAALHSCGIDTHPSKYGFDAVQVSATSVPSLRAVFQKLRAAHPSAEGGAAEPTCPECSGSGGKQVGSGLLGPDWQECEACAAPAVALPAAPELPPLQPLPEPRAIRAGHSFPKVYALAYTADQVQDYAREYGKACASVARKGGA